ncbi:hypothetical protein QYE76_006077 [Lolium multiflorum]|uniref:Uncharacterized protein n=1 Tax=Lolium multiflorum TaxID=4521 RepID=A0AAD8RVP3_LOLMU|nr:hypothetical protein QYE76_006077 [Lolium multiflorum]
MLKLSNFAEVRRRGIMMKDAATRWAVREMGLEDYTWKISEAALHEEFGLDCPCICNIVDRILGSGLAPLPAYPRPAAVFLHPPSLPRSVRLDHFIPADGAELDLGTGAGELLAATIEYLEREPAATADNKVPLADLSPRELQLVLVYFAQEGRDAYCALEGFDGLCRPDRIHGETLELMTAIACGWIERIVGTGGDVSALLGEMDCVGLRPGFSLVEKNVTLYWDRSERARAVEFVRDVHRRGSVIAGADYDDETGGPVGYLAWEMVLSFYGPGFLHHLYWCGQIWSMTMYLTRSPPNLLMCMGSEVSFFGCVNGPARPRIL